MCIRDRYNAEGRHGLDASVVEWHTRRAGAVAGVETIRNPVKLARAVMEPVSYTHLDVYKRQMA